MPLHSCSGFVFMQVTKGEHHYHVAVAFLLWYTCLWESLYGIGYMLKSRILKWNVIKQNPVEVKYGESRRSHTVSQSTLNSLWVYFPVMQYGALWKHYARQNFKNPPRHTKKVGHTQMVSVFSWLLLYPNYNIACKPERIRGRIMCVAEGKGRLISEKRLKKQYKLTV